MAPLIGGFGGDASALLETNVSCKLHRLSARDELSYELFWRSLMPKAMASAAAIHGCSRTMRPLTSRREPWQKKDGGKRASGL